MRQGEGALERGNQQVVEIWLNVSRRQEVQSLTRSSRLMHGCRAGRRGRGRECVRFLRLAREPGVS